jgi:hypothetical protein
LVGADPIAYLRSSGDELHVRRAVYTKAWELSSERRNAEMRIHIEGLTALVKQMNALGKLIARKPTL